MAANVYDSHQSSESGSRDGPGANVRLNREAETSEFELRRSDGAKAETNLHATSLRQQPILLPGRFKCLAASVTSETLELLGRSQFVLALALSREKFTPNSI